MAPPKLFISYAWTNSEHEQRVIDFASELVESHGVDVILDKWHLREGHDAIAFMESMVNDSDIKKVIIICDKGYVDRTNSRIGGVGTEAQIISKEIYDGAEQNKFVAVVFEKDEHGKAFLPTYYTSRIFIDLSSDERYSENYEQLLRWIYDKPVNVRPELGKPPEFITNSTNVSLGTSLQHRRALESITSARVNSAGVASEYFERFIDGMKKLQIENFEPEIDDLIVTSIEAFEPSRNEFLSIISAIARHNGSTELFNLVLRFFENALSFYEYKNNAPTYTRHQLSQDNYKFIVHELFLYTIAKLIQYNHFPLVKELLTANFYINYEHKEKTGSYLIIEEHLHSLSHRANRLNLRRISLHCDLLHSRNSSSDLNYSSLMQADFICFLHSDLFGDGRSTRWWPTTLLRAYEHRGAFEIFARSESSKYFSQIMDMLSITSKDDIQILLLKYSKNQLTVPSWEMQGFNPAVLVGFDRLSTKP